MLEKNYLNHNVLLQTCCLLLFLFITVASSAQNNLKTRYERGFFETEASIETTTSLKEKKNIITDIDKRLRRLEIDSLEWLTKGLSGKEEGKNLIDIDYNDGMYDPNTELFDIFINIWVRIVNKQFKNIRITVLMKYENDENGFPIITAELFNPNFFLKNAGGTLSIKQTESKKQFVVHAAVRFGWFFNLFVTTSNYCNVVEWRLQTILENLKKEAEQRDNNS